jgi:hypothetical protein
MLRDPMMPFSMKMLMYLVLFNMDSLTKLKCKIAHKYEIHQMEEDAETLEKKIKQNVGLEEFTW